MVHLGHFVVHSRESDWEMVLIKAYLGNDARRITVEDDIPFADLRAMLMKLFAVSGSGEPITPPAPTQFWMYARPPSNCHAMLLVHGCQEMLIY